ncbi:HesB/YadR/YfhF family protein [Shouchella patagoniensis]|uniref:HesB/YadR/YfhF family protein n=1 Tax=Shouchella patagoniensis TaxID=228576 RepID=UPI000995AD47|nr:HesB/YadR/YfhF family protein [Shouchella patagoniensis]
MNIYITKPALAWFKEEFETGDNLVPIRLFGRYGGCGSLQSGFSLGISQAEPLHPVTIKEEEGFRFFVEEQDSWYFDQHDVKIKYSRKLDEIQFEYEDSDEE